MKRFPEFDSFLFKGFPKKAQIDPLSPLRLPIPPYPHIILIYIITKYLIFLYFLVS